MLFWNILSFCVYLSLLRYNQATLEIQINSPHHGIQDVPQSHQDDSRNSIGPENRLLKRDFLHFDSEMRHVISPQPFHPEAFEPTVNGLQHSGTGASDLHLEHALSPTTEEWMSLLLQTDEPSPHSTPPAQTATSHASPSRLQSSNSIASPELMITPPTLKRKFPFAIPVNDDGSELVRHPGQKHQDFARKITDAFIQSEASSYDMKSIAQAYFRAQEREDVNPENRLPGNFFGEAFVHSADDPPRLKRALGEANIDMMIFYAPEDFHGLMDTWTKQGLNSDGDFFEDLKNEVEDDFARGIYSEPLVNEALSLSQFIGDVKKRLSRHVPLTYNYEVMIEMAKATEFWSSTRIFTESEALDALEKLNQLLRSDPLTYFIAENWLNEFSVPRGRWSLKIKHLKELETKASDRILQAIAYSTDISPRGVAGDETFNAAMLAGFNAKNAWKQLAKLPQKSPFRSQLLKALNEWDLLTTGKLISLKNKVFLDAAVKYHSTVVTLKAFRRKDITGADLALSTWVALHNTDLSRDTIEKTLEKQVPNLSQANRLLQQGASARLQLQSLVAIVFPWAYERYYALPTMGHENDFSVAASTFLIMRKRLNNVLRFSPEEKIKFKTELIEFLGTENYDQRMKQIIQISDEIRHAINMRNMQNLAAQEGLEVASRKHWYHYLKHLNRLHQQRPETFERLGELYRSFSEVTKNRMPPFSMNQFYTYINHCAYLYIEELFHSGISLETAAELTAANWNLFKAIEDANEHILSVIQARFPPESDAKAVYVLTQGIRRKAAENYEGLLRWREKYNVLTQTMSKDFVKYIQEIDSEVISISDVDFEEKGYPGYPIITAKVHKAPPHFQLTRMVQNTLGPNFFSNRKYLLMHRRNNSKN
ncbi:uncharacterized protein MELLADRAFT_58483 [Melampsora larici-populina 98AG31]|uniref:Secreted protein n=1 Tax=Melampsora larici-populina (strain 98AG31 / pathotype 3-4-7) TaxID=747676 RepID=F4R3N6_MELLP|nr:uncharacterized protein MELLADRAFT_58483 [Melampsora larici-populina 98AG31]EGG13137.1 hypothetical protein MELLADRAFT_58483 [Melampsora larici-populina 98AG31]